MLIIHYHEDHTGAVKLFGEITDVYAPPESLEILRNPPEIPEYRKIGWGQPEGFEAKPVSDTMRFDDVTIKVIKTPGHSFDLVSYLTDKKLFCGDLIISTSQMVCMREEDLTKTIESIEKVLKVRERKGVGKGEHGQITSRIAERLICRACTHIGGAGRWLHHSKP